MQINQTLCGGPYQPIESEDSRPRLEALVAQDGDLRKGLVKEALDQLLQAEMTEFLGEAPGERCSERLGYRAGYYERGLITRIGKIELRVPRDRSELDALDMPMSYFAD